MFRSLPRHELIDHFPCRPWHGGLVSSSRRYPHASRVTMHATRAFTLLEVLVALAVLALALGALVRAGGEQARSMDHLRTKSFAEWVAADQLARSRLADPWPETGTQHGIARMGRRQWHWRQSVTRTQDEDIRRIEVAVRLEPEAETPITTLAGFAGRY